MKTAINQYLAILRLDNALFLDLKQSPNGLRWVLGLVLIVGLVAGSGKWLNLNYQLERATTAEQVEQLTEQSAEIGTQVEQVGNDLTGVMAWLFAEPLAQVAAFFGRDLVEFGTNLAPKLVEAEPPIGARSSRVVTLIGDWLSTPFTLLANSLVFILVTLVVAKIYDGNGTLLQHLSLMLLMVSPAFLLFFSYLSPRSFLLIYAIRPMSRLLSLVFVGWAVLIGAKALTVVHDLDWKTALKVIGTAALLLYVIAPIVSVLVFVYLIA